MDKELILNKKAHIYLKNNFHYFGEIIEIDEGFISIKDDKTGLKVLEKSSISRLEIENYEE